MKISAMSTDQASDVLVRIMEPVMNILKDKEAIEILNSAIAVQGVDGADSAEGVIAVLMRVVPYCLKKHRTDTYEILGALSGKTKAAIGKQNILVSIRDIADSVDKDLIDFFKSLAPADSEETE